MVYPYSRETAELTTRKGPGECDAFFDKTRDEWKADPNNVIYKFVTTVTKKDVTDPAEWKIFKRRQRTKDGAEDPKNPCDDKGKPLFVTPEGELTAKAEGGEIAWGPWIDAIRGDVSTETIAKSQRCHGERIKLHGGYYRSSMSEKEIEDAIARDKAFHDKQQASRASKIAVDYKHELAKPESSHPEWECKIKKEKAREFPATWASVKYSPLKAATDPIEIAFSYDKRVKNEKTGKHAIVHTGVGNFKGRIAVTEKLKSGQVFGMRALDDNLTKAGFENVAEASDYPKYALRVPGSGDICLVEMSREDFPYAANYFANKRLESKEGKVYIGGMFRSARFEIARTPHSEPRRVFESQAKVYHDKAPKKSVEFCHGKFDEAVKNSLVKLEEPVPKSKPEGST